MVRFVGFVLLVGWIVGCVGFGWLNLLVFVLFVGLTCRFRFDGWLDCWFCILIIRCVFEVGYFCWLILLVGLVRWIS